MTLDPVDRALLAIIYFSGAILLYVLFMVLFSLNAEQKCRSAGYPRSLVTWNLDTYCMTLDGSVTVKAQKQ